MILSSFGYILDEVSKRDIVHKTLVIPDSVQSIHPHACIEKVGLQSILFPPCLRTIGWEAFMGCRALRTIMLPDLITVLDARAFQDCEKLMQVVMPNSLCLIREGAFENCPELRAILVPGASDEDIIKIKGLLPERLKSCVKSVSSNVIKSASVVRDTARAQILEKIRLKHDRSDIWASALIPPELVTREIRGYNVLSACEKKLANRINAFLQMTPLPEGHDSMAAYTVAIQQQALLFQLQHIHDGVNRITVSKTLPEGIKHDAMKKAGLIAKLVACVEGRLDICDAVLPKEAIFFLIEGKGRIKSLLTDHHPELLSELKQIAIAEKEPEASFASSVLSRKA